MNINNPDRRYLMHSYNLNTRFRLNQLVDITGAAMTNERFSKRIIQMMDDIIHSYAKYDGSEKCYNLEYDQIDELDLQRLTGQLFIDQQDIGSEATGPDNDLYDKKMLSSLIILLKDSTNKDLQSDFIANWLEGSVSYTRHKITDLLSWRVEEYNADIQYDARGY